MKKIILIFILVFLFLPFLVLADEQCPDYCEDGIFYSGTYARGCTYSRQTCYYDGCDGDKCAGRPATPTPTTESRPTLQILSSPTPTQTLIIDDSRKTEKKEEAPTCDNYCIGGTKYFKGKPTAQGSCFFEKKVCEEGCNLENKGECNPVFKIGPAYFIDPNDNKVKPIPEAMVKMTWFYHTGDIDNKVMEKPLPDRATNLDGTITVSKSELYKYLANDLAAHLEIKVELRDFNNRFEILDESNGKQVPFLLRSIYIANPVTHKFDFNFDVSTKDRINAKIYYHNWEAVNFSEKVLGTKVQLLLPESVVINSTENCVACHASTDNSASTPNDWGIFYIAPTLLSNPNSAENLEWHEFCHHIMMDEFGYMVPWLGPCPCVNSKGENTCNHCGYANPDSGDSWLEGWAEFCALAIKDYYKYSNSNIYSTFGDMEVNFPVKSSEEFSVASALWDLYDPIGTDGVQLSIQQIWNVLRAKHVFIGETTQRHIHTFYDVYWAFYESYLPGLNDDVDKNGVNNLDDIFISRDCFGDKNLSDLKVKWDPGEPIGFTYKPFDSTNIRPNRPRKPGAYIAVSLKDKNNKEIQGARAKIKVTFQNDSCGLGENCDYEYEVPVENGKVYMEPPPEDFDATVEMTVFSQEKNVKLAKFTVKDYWKKYDVKKDFVESYDLKVDNFKNIPQSQLFLSDIVAKASQEKVTVKSSELTNSVYKISGFQDVKLLAIKPIKMKVEMEIDAQTGKILKLKKPWWSFLVF